MAERVVQQDEALGLVLRVRARRVACAGRGGRVRVVSADDARRRLERIRAPAAAPPRLVSPRQDPRRPRRGAAATRLRGRIRVVPATARLRLSAEIADVPAAERRQKRDETAPALLDERTLALSEPTFRAARRPRADAKKWTPQGLRPGSSRRPADLPFQ